MIKTGYYVMLNIKTLDPLGPRIHIYYMSMYNRSKFYGVDWNDNPKYKILFPTKIKARIAARHLMRVWSGEDGEDRVSVSIGCLCES